MLNRTLAFCALALSLAAGLCAAEADPSKGLTENDIELKSAGPLAFGPHGILFVADPVAATVYAIDTGDSKASESSDRPMVEGIDEKVASMLGTKAAEVAFKDLAVNPASGNVYLSVARGTGPKASAAVLKVSRKGEISEVSTKKVRSAKAEIPNANDKKRAETITDMAYVNGRLLVAGLSSEEWASNLRAIPYPFEKTDKGASIKIFHGAHGKFETAAPIRVLAPYKLAGEDTILAAYTCTPLVRMPAKELEPGKKIEATTIAELGNGNQPLSMIVYSKGGKDFALIANSRHGLLKVSLDGADKIEGIVKPVKGTAGAKFDRVTDVTGVQKLDAYGKDAAVVLAKAGTKTDLRTIDLP